jgi:RHS repeat-associated protein
LYFYHGNHLSSTQVITDVHANISQAVLYTPWGSVIKEYKADWMLDTIPRYLFNAKEKDEESGLYYYEARYYSDENIMFTARDPHFESYPTWSPYAYCYNNPVRYIDPTGMDGYDDGNGNYQWFDDKTDDTFIDDNNATWTKVSSDKNAWNQATTIRDAVVTGLVQLGNDEAEVKKDVGLFSGDSPLFTKEAKINNADKYTSDWTPKYNSDSKKDDALQSSEISKTGFALKYYPTKGGEKNAIGIVKSNSLLHVFEAGMETIERKIWKSNATNDPLYDMHYNNARKLLNGIDGRFKPTPTDYTVPIYYQTGGMR